LQELLSLWQLDQNSVPIQLLIALFLLRAHSGAFTADKYNLEATGDSTWMGEAMLDPAPTQSSALFDASF
jgi:hypothetical protein